MLIKNKKRKTLLHDSCVLGHISLSEGSSVKARVKPFFLMNQGNPWKQY